MGGTNNLRCGGTAEEVISDLEALQEKCRANDIEPVLLTIPPIAPDRIWKYYQQPTAENWKVEFDKVNGWIRTQTHIDTAAPCAMYEDMPENLAADGLHPDKEAKEKMGKIINEKFPEIRKKISETKIQRETHRHSRWFFLCGPRAYLTSGASTRLRPVHLHPTSCYP